MRRWSLQLGRVFGVEVRMHLFFLLLLPALAALSVLAGWGGARAVGLWFLLLVAVAVREIARSLAVAWYGMELRGLLLLPTGGVMTFATVDATERAAEPAMHRRLAAVGPVANTVFAVVLAGIVLSVAPSVDLMARPWITPGHLVRAMVWLNVLMAGISLLPTFPDARRFFARGTPGGQEGKRAVAEPQGVGGALGRAAGFGSNGLAAAVSQAAAIGMIVAGVAWGNHWLIVWGVILAPLMLLGAHMENQGLMVQSDVEAVRMRDVMLTQFSTLSASDTLEDALERAVHTLQDVFPVVRGRSLVGAVSRQSIVEALATQGNSYVQGVMTKSFQTAQPDDSLVNTLRRIMGDRSTQLVPVMEGEQIVGIITPQNLSLSMGLIGQSRRLRRPQPPQQ
jgi:CBS domain-containing protein